MKIKLGGTAAHANCTVALFAALMIATTAAAPGARAPGRTQGPLLIEKLELEAMSRDGVHEFAFILQPLKRKGATDSTVAPIGVR